MNRFSLFLDFKSLETVNLFLEVFGHLNTYILLINSWLYIEFEVEQHKLFSWEGNQLISASSACLPLPPKIENKLGDRMIKQLLNSVIAKYCDLSVSRRSIICLSLRLRQIIDLLATDKSRYFAQPRPIIVNYCQGKKHLSKHFNQVT